jgi:hypothetical protein
MKWQENYMSSLIRVIMGIVLQNGRKLPYCSSTKKCQLITVTHSLKQDIFDRKEALLVNINSGVGTTGIKEV